jgi:hypothetical protein
MLRKILGDDGVKYLQPIFAYLFNNIGKYQYREAFEDKALQKEVWARVANSGYILKNCKLFLYAAHINRLQGQSTSPARFGIEQEDVRLLNKLDLKYSNKFKAYSLFDFDNLEGAMLWSDQMRTYMGKFINKKLRFLASYGLSNSEIEAQLVEYALWVLRWKYPRYETELHTLNICKNAIHSKGMLLIQHWTRDKRQTLVREHDGTFQHKFVQLEFASEVQVRPEHEHYELEWDLQSVTKSLDGKQARIFEALSGAYDPGVTMFLGMSNVEAAQQWSFERYQSAVADYHQVPAESVQHLLTSVRPKFGI